MTLVIILLFLMPPNPYFDEKKPIIQPKFPPLMNAGIKRIDPALGEKRALIILVDFDDNQYTYNADTFDSLVYGDNQQSLRDYYSEVSHGKFTISKTSEVTQWFRVAEDYSFYIGDSFGLYPGTFPNNVQGIVYDVCALCDPYVNFADFDENGDGIVDALFIVHAGPGAEETGNPSYVWSHQWQLSNTGTGCPGAYATNDGVSVDHYSMEPERFETQTGRITVGVFAHEFGHILGLPDLYDRDGSTYGIGIFGIMAAGSWGQAQTQDLPGSSPSHFCSWSKYQLGFVTPIALEHGGVTKSEHQSVTSAATNAIAYRLLEDPYGPDWKMNGGNGEYFLVENRYRTGFDKSLPGDGLLILHVDDSETDNDDEHHPLVGIMQADGDNNFLLSNWGSAADLWKDDSTGFGEASIPSSHTYDDNPTGVCVYDIGPADSVMIASFWLGPVLLFKTYAFPNPFIDQIGKHPSWGKKMIITYEPSDTTGLTDPTPPFTVTIYNIAAERVRVLDIEGDEVDKDTRQAFWDLKNDKGEDVVSGMYLFIIKTEGEKVEKNKGRMTIIR
jgi:immune inhibitor A